MKRLKKITLKVIGLIAIIICSIIAVFGLWLYSGSLNNFKIKVFTNLPLPVALVNGKALYMPNYTLRWQTFLKLQENKLSGLVPTEAKKQIFKQMVLDEEIAQVAAQKNIFINTNDLETEYINQATETGKETYNLIQFLATYNLSKISYEQYAIKPQLLAVRLRVWFNSQTELNLKQYTLAKTLVEQVKSGQNMADLAKQHTEEDIGKIVGGDLGFIDPTKLLFELREPVYAMNVGDIIITPSRAGIHVIKLEEKQANEYHLRQIFLLTEDFDTWLETQTENFKIYKLINF